MGTINERVRSNGRKTYTAQIVKKRNGTTLLSISETFPKKAQANAWMARKEEEIATRGLDAFLAGGKTLGMAIERYRTEKAGLGRTATQVLRTLEADEIARLSCNEITPDKIYDLALRLRRTRKAQTVGNYLNTLSAVFRTAPRAFGIPLPRQAMLDALESCRSLGTIGKSEERDRRPTLEELDKLFAYFHARRDTSKVPMLEICFFAIFAARRLDETCRIRWSDLRA